MSDHPAGPPPGVGQARPTHRVVSRQPDRATAPASGQSDQPTAPSPLGQTSPPRGVRPAEPTRGPKSWQPNRPDGPQIPANPPPGIRPSRPPKASEPDRLDRPQIPANPTRPTARYQANLTDPPPLVRQIRSPDRPSSRPRGRLARAAGSPPKAVPAQATAEEPGHRNACRSFAPVGELMRSAGSVRILRGRGRRRSGRHFARRSTGSPTSGRPPDRPRTVPMLRMPGIHHVLGSSQRRHLPLATNGGPAPTGRRLSGPAPCPSRRCLPTPGRASAQ